MSKEFKFVVVRTAIQKTEMCGTGDTLEEAMEDAIVCVKQNDTLGTPDAQSQWEDVDVEFSAVPVACRDMG